MLFRSAQGQVAQTVTEELGSRGILSSTITGDRLIQGTAALVPEFEKIARAEHREDMDMKLEVASFLSDLDTKEFKTFQDQNQRTREVTEFVMDLSDRQYEIYRDKVNDDFNNEKFAFEQALEIANVQRKDILECC